MVACDSQFRNLRNCGARSGSSDSYLGTYENIFDSKTGYMKIVHNHK